MIGMDRQSGRAITEQLPHIRQSVATILTTLVGTRIERRDFGSILPLLADQPLNGATLLRAYSATVVALLAWEPRIRVVQITRSVDANQHGIATLSLQATTTSGDPLRIDVPVGGPASAAAIAPNDLETILEGEYALQQITQVDRPDVLGDLT